MRFRGTVYRAHNPQWSWTPLSGEGASRHGGRFNSFAAGAGPDDLNLVLWRWGVDRPVRVLLVDDEGRLSRGAIAS